MTVYVTGVGADVSGITELLGNAIGSEVHKLTQLTGINMEKAFPEGNFSEFTRKNIDINFGLCYYIIC